MFDLVAACSVARAPVPAPSPTHMTTHLYPGSKPSFRQYGFKPKLATHSWQRPTGGNPSAPGVYEKKPQSIHLRTYSPPRGVRRSACMHVCESV